MTDRIRAYWQALQEALGSRRLFAAAGILGAAALAFLFWAGLPGSGHEAVSFNADVRPIFNEYCLACHGGVRQKNGYSLLFKETALDTPESGKRAIVPSDPGASELMARITHPDPSERMPPEGKDPLTDGGIATVETWIEQGAEWKRHWAYRPPDEPAPPEVTGSSRPENPIDRFVLARLDSLARTPEIDAERADWLEKARVQLGRSEGDPVLYVSNPEGVSRTLRKESIEALNDGFVQRCEEVDQPMTALIKDLEQRGLLEETLVVWGGEFGRTPMLENRSGSDNPYIGRDHHNSAYTMWMAGGGVKKGHTHGKTDDIGYHPVEGQTHVHDLQATILHLLGFDHTELTYPFQGRDFRLTDVHGHVVDEIIA